MSRIDNARPLLPRELGRLLQDRLETRLSLSFQQSARRPVLHLRSRGRRHRASITRVTGCCGHWQTETDHSAAETREAEFRSGGERMIVERAGDSPEFGCVKRSDGRRPVDA